MGEQIQVTIRRENGTETAVVLPSTVPLRQIMPALAQQLHLPPASENGHQLDYYLTDRGRRLDGDQSLRELGVQARAKLTLIQQETAMRRDYISITVSDNAPAPAHPQSRRLIDFGSTIVRLLIVLSVFACLLLLLLVIVAIGLITQAPL